MRKTKLILYLFCQLTMISFYPLPAASADVKKSVDIVVTESENGIIKNAATQLSNYLNYVYPDYNFTVTSTIPHSGTDNIQVLLGTAEDIALPQTMKSMVPQQDEGFIIKKISDKKVLITSHTDKGIFNAVYSLLDKLGYGFFLSFETKPEPKRSLSFNDWEIIDFPLKQDRIVFDWHNFLSGCTGWSYEEWKSWIDQSAKMRYNTIMVHAYGNNPMFSFEYNGQKKEVGYLSTSNSGRDWGTQHINDVRLLPGGEIFRQPVFGSEAAIVPDEKRNEAAMHMMSLVFGHAKEMGMKIVFAIDMDTWMANPRNIIESLPPDCRIKLESQDVVNPDTPEGYKYYKAQVSSLLKSYPQITDIAVWMRTGSTLWLNIKPEQFPVEWAKEWRQLVKLHPELAEDKLGASNFAMSKIVKAYQKAVKELKYNNINICLGSWHWNFMSTANLLLPKDVAFIPLDWAINFDTFETKEILANIGRERKIIPIVWAHHDDHRYIGKPYTPYANFNKLLDDRNVNGFGIIHWTTRPLDLYFKSLSDQVWHGSENKQLSETVNDFCKKAFGSDQQELLTYMSEWITNGPMFGRETSDYFIDLGGPKVGASHETSDQVLNKAEYRIGLISKINKRLLSKEGEKMINYFFQNEQFYISFFRNQQKCDKAFEILKRGNIDSAKIMLKNVDPENSIRLYVKAASNLEMTAGEKALVVSMGTRWLPSYMNLKQRARLEDIHFKFGITKEDPLAQASGSNSYFIDESKVFWKFIGEKELGVTGKPKILREFSSGTHESASSWIGVADQLSIPMTTFGKDQLPTGEYKISLNYQKITQNSNLPFSVFLVNHESEIPLNADFHNMPLKQSTAIVRFRISEKEKYYLKIKTRNTNSLKLYSMIIAPL